MTAHRTWLRALSTLPSVNFVPYSHSLDRSGDYDMRSGGGNPSVHFSVRQYLKSIQTEQAEARISSTQATSPFFNKFHRIVLHLRALLHSRVFYRTESFGSGKVKKPWIFYKTRMQKFTYSSTSRKILKRRAFQTNPCSTIEKPCHLPVDNLKFLPTLFTAMQISLAKGFLFRTTTKHA